MNQWHALADTCTDPQEKRWCYQRAIEEDEEDYESRALFKALGNGPMRAPKSISREIVFLPRESQYRADQTPAREPPALMVAALQLATLAAALATLAAALAVTLAALRIGGFL